MARAILVQNGVAQRLREGMGPKSLSATAAGRMGFLFAAILLEFQILTLDMPYAVNSDESRVVTYFPLAVGFGGSYFDGH